MATAAQTAVPVAARPATLSVKALLASGVANWQLIDIRSADEFAAGHIPTSINIPIEELPSRIADIRTAAKTVIVCQQGYRAAFALDILAARAVRLGLSDASMLDGGINAWVLAGQSLLTTTATRWSIDRQVRLGAGALIFTAALLGFTVSHIFLYIAAVFALALTLSGVTGFCGMARVLALMPWNNPPKPKMPPPSSPSGSQAIDTLSKTPTACSLSKRCCQ
jgi:rhodanese-related sulfurtransferase